MPFFSSLTYNGTRVGGQRERETQLFEAGLACYPRDYPSTAGYRRYAQDREAEEKGRWEKKPKAKRTNWPKLGTRSPWQPDWDVVLGLKQEQGAEVLVSTQREDPTQIEALLHDHGQGLRPWLLCGPEVSVLIATCCKLPSDPHVSLLSEMNKLRAKRLLGPLPETISAEDLWRCALVRVRLRMCRRGSPSDMAIIYQMGDPEVVEWRKLASIDADDVPGEEAEVSNCRGCAIDACIVVDSWSQLGRRACSQADIIGYVTTGNYSLSRGAGFSIGAIAVAKLMMLVQQTQRFGAFSLGLGVICMLTLVLRLGSAKLLVKVRDRDGDVCRGAMLEVLDD